MTVPIANPVVSDSAKDAVIDVLDSGMLADGEYVRSFEEAFAEYVGVKHAVATSSGTTALHAMLEASGIGDGDVVITSPFSFIASANAVVHAGATPMFADIRAETYAMDPGAVREAIRRHDDVAALLPIHLYGLPADMDAFRRIAADHDLLLFADAAQAHGGEIGERKAGSIADAAAFSFYPTKNMTTGEGGMVVTDDAELARNVRQLIDHGQVGRYRHEVLGYNYRMTNIQAAIGGEQLSRLPGWIKRRRENARRLTEQLSGVDAVIKPATPPGRTHAFHQYTVRVPNRAEVKRRLENADIGYGVYYPTTIPEQPAYGLDVDCPTARRAAEEVISLPIHPRVTGNEIKLIADVLLGGIEGSL